MVRTIRLSPPVVRPLQAPSRMIMTIMSKEKQLQRFTEKVSAMSASRFFRICEACPKKKVKPAIVSLTCSLFPWQAPCRNPYTDLSFVP